MSDLPTGTARILRTVLRSSCRVSTLLIADPLHDRLATLISDLPWRQALPSVAHWPLSATGPLGVVSRVPLSIPSHSDTSRGEGLLRTCAPVPSLTHSLPHPRTGQHGCTKL